MDINNEYVHVRINRGARVLWEGEARALSSRNAVGPFDILPMHASFLTYVMDTEILVDLDAGRSKRFSCKEGIVHVTNNQVQVYLDL